MDFNVVATLLGNMGIGGILAWYLWYTTTVSQPRLLSEFRADMQDERHQRNGLYGTLRDLVEELRRRPCMMTGRECKYDAEDQPKEHDSKG